MPLWPYSQSSGGQGNLPLAQRRCPSYLIGDDDHLQPGETIMQGQNRILDDIAKLLTNAAGAAKGMSEEIETLVRQQAERVMTSLDFMPREEFDVLKAMIVKVQKENDALSQRVAALEKSQAGAKGSQATAKTKAKSQKKPAAKKKS